MARIGLLFLGIIGLTATAAAQERPLNNSANAGGTTTTTTTTDTGNGAGTSSSDVAMHDEQANMETAPTEHTPGATHHPRDATDPYEDPHESYYSVGIFYRHFIAPTYALNFFVDGGKVIDEPGGGVQFTYRKDGLSISGQVWGQSAAFSGIFRQAGMDPDNTEFWQSSWGVVWAAASFMWSTQFNDMLALEYGFDVGIGVVFGQAYRTEAYNTMPGAPGSPNNYNNWAPCQYTGAGVTRTAPQFPPSPGTMGGSEVPGFMVTGAGAGSGTCNRPAAPDGSSGEQYGEPIRNWSQGGSVPVVVPWLGVPHIALRFKPIKQLEIRVDAGAFAAVLAFYMGGSIAYGF